MDKNRPASAGTRVQSLVQEASTCSRASRPVSQLPGPALWLPKPTQPRTWAPQQEKPPPGDTLTLQLESSPCSLQLEKASLQQQSPSTTKIIAVCTCQKKKDGNIEGFCTPLLPQTDWIYSYMWTISYFCKRKASKAADWWLHMEHMRTKPQHIPRRGQHSAATNHPWEGTHNPSLWSKGFGLHIRHPNL